MSLLRSGSTPARRARPAFLGLRTYRFASLLLLTLTLLAGCSDKKYTSLGQPDVWKPEGIQDFELTERSGRKITKADLLGKPSLCCFIFTRCVSACPHVVDAMRRIQTDFPDLDVRLVAFSVDPDYDTVQVLKEFADNNGADKNRWWFLTGKKGTIYRLIHESFLTLSAELVMPDPEDLPTPGNSDVLHSAYIMYVDANGKVQGKFNARNAEEYAELRKILRTPPVVRQFPAVNASLNASAAVLLVAGWIFIRYRNARAHKLCMLTAFGVSIVFLGFYLVYHYYAGSKKFEGEGAWRTAYLVMLFSHIVLAALVPVLAGVTIWQGLRAEKSGNWPRHRRMGTLTLPIWLYVSVTGVIIYAVLYHGPAIQENYAAVQNYFRPAEVEEP